MPTVRITQFKADIQRARDLVGLGQAIGAMTAGTVDATDVYRSGIVQGVAAMDHYFHGVVLDRAVNILLGRNAPGAGSKVGLPFNAVQAIVNAPSPIEAELHARAFLAERLSLETYQRPDDIAAALAMVGVPKAWSTAFKAPASVKTAISIVVRRRNRIVHQCDTDPLTPGTTTPLSATDVLDSISTVEQAVEGLDPHL